MKSFATCNWLLAAICAAPAFAVAVRAQGSSVDSYGDATARIIVAATSNVAASAAWSRLAELTDKFPARLSGSANLANAIQWAADQMKRDGLENVRVDKVMVPYWVRGEERGEIVAPWPQALVVAALGGSVGTPADGVEAEAIVVKNFVELEAKDPQLKGKIVVYNVPFRSDRDPAATYRDTVQYRVTGASRAAARGAVAALVRSVGPPGYRTPHTGSMRYTPGVAQIPAAAISAEDADKLQRMQDRGDRVFVRLTLGATTLPDAESGNVIAELRGRETPGELVLVGCHLDSWDLGAGAMDDGGGCIATWEALRLLKKLNMIPRRTIRLVLFTNEENGTRGGTGYRDKYADELINHVLMLESDNGVLPLKGWGFSGSAKARAVIADVAGLLKGIGADQVSDRFGGADIEPSVEQGVPGISPEVDMSRYFVIHHTPADTVDKIAPADLGRHVAAVASMAFVVADMPEVLPR
jgi:carboxypeptidase Q